MKAEEIIVKFVKKWTTTTSFNRVKPTWDGGFIIYCESESGNLLKMKICTQSFVKFEQHALIPTIYFI